MLQQCYCQFKYSKTNLHTQIRCNNLSHLIIIATHDHILISSLKKQLLQSQTHKQMGLFKKQRTEEIQHNIIKVMKGSSILKITKDLSTL